MSYIYQGSLSTIEWPLASISINKLNIVVKDNKGSTQFFTFKNTAESKNFLAHLYVA